MNGAGNEIVVVDLRDPSGKAPAQIDADEARARGDARKARLTIS